MTPFDNLPIQRKLMALSLLASGSALALASAVFLAYDVLTFRHALVRSLSVQAEIIGANSASSVLFQDVPSAERTLSALRARPGIMTAGIYDAQGKPFAAWTRDTASFRPLPPFFDGKEERYSFEGDAISLVRPMFFDGSFIGSVYIQSDLQELHGRVARYVVILGAVLLLALAAAALVSARFARGISRPVLDLVQTAKAVSVDKDYSVRAPGGGKDEVGLLVGTFNEMLAQIQAQGEDLRKSHDELELRVKERTAELEAANKELEAFGYSVSHDLRAPLRSIDGFSQAIMDDCGDKLTDEGRDSLRRVRAATKRMAELIDGMLSLSRVARQELARETVDLGAMVRAIVEDLRRGAPSRAVDLVVGEGLAVTGDPKLLRAVLENLLGNAWKFTAKKKSARIEVGSFLKDDGGRAYFVKDNGAGFSMDFVHKLFGVFQRLHAVDDFAGTGIGLATVQRIVIRHGGRIWAEGRVGEGATFYFTLS